MDSDSLNSQLEHLYSSAEAATYEGLVDEAIRRCETAMTLLDQNYEEELSFTHSDFLMVAGHACWKDGDNEGAFRYYRQAYSMEMGRTDALVAMGVALFYLCRFSAAAHYLELASVEEPDSGEVWYFLGILALRAGDVQKADFHFERAEELEPERQRPVFLPVERISAILEEMYSRYPEDIRRAMENVPIILEDRPSEAMLFSDNPPLDPLMLGIFEGTPLPERADNDLAAGLTRIVLFLENIALVAPDEEKLIEELDITLKHEIGHFLGLDEDDLLARGLD
ncbi:MAG: metallopeptidase family protein [Sumerlaeia bacterium]